MKYKQILIIIITVMQDILERLDEVSQSKPRSLNQIAQLQQTLNELEEEE